MFIFSLELKYLRLLKDFCLHKGNLHSICYNNLVAISALLWFLLLITILNSHLMKALLTDPSLYRRQVGKLNFLTNTRPDIVFSIQHLSQFLQHSREPHFQAALHVLRYLKGEPSLGILLSKSPTYDLLAYCDAEWATSAHSRRYVSGFVVFFGKILIVWKSKKQAIISLPSIEAE